MHAMTPEGVPAHLADLPDMNAIRDLLRASRTIAVVGLSPKPDRPSHLVASHLQAAGYRIVPVNPGQDQILGQPCYPSLEAIPPEVDIHIVDIFRRADQVEPIVRQAIARRARAVWMQQGIVNHEAARLAREAGLLVVMDRCLKIDHMQILGQERGPSL